MAKMPPGFVVDAPIVEGAVIRLSESDRRHVRARRLRAGSRVRVSGPAGAEAEGVVERLDRSGCEIRIGRLDAPGRGLSRVALFVPPIRVPRLSWLVEKATELGAGELRLVASERAQGGRVEGARSAIDRLHRVAVEAAKQSRSRAPSIAGPVSFAEAAAAARSHASALILDSGGAPFPATVAAPCALWVGPEGGWNGGEIEEAERRGWTRVRLPGATLRAETAAIAALVLALRSLTGPAAAADNNAPR